MAIKIIATDLDGTLMAPDHLTVTKRTKDALLSAHDKGVKIAISTGRTLSMIDNVTEQIPFVDYIMYSNGASVYDCKKDSLIVSNHMIPELTGQLIDFLNGYPVFYKVYADGKIYIQEGAEKNFVNFGLPNQFVDSIYKLMIPCPDLREALKDTDSEIISVYYSDEKDGREISKYFGSRNDLNLTSAIEYEVEVTAKTADKGIALDLLCKHLDISSDEAMSFGDAPNDCPMLRYASYSFAMGNAHELCKRTASYITSSNADNGVAEAIEKYVLKEQTV